MLKVTKFDNLIGSVVSEIPTDKPKNLTTLKNCNIKEYY